jgi:hypothetical protein
MTDRTVVTTYRTAVFVTKPLLWHSVMPSSLIAGSPKLHTTARTALTTAGLTLQVKLLLNAQQQQAANTLANVLRASSRPVHISCTLYRTCQRWFVTVVRLRLRLRQRRLTTTATLAATIAGLLVMARQLLRAQRRLVLTIPASVPRATSRLKCTSCMQYRIFQVKYATSATRLHRRQRLRGATATTALTTAGLIATAKRLLNAQQQ